MGLTRGYQHLLTDGGMKNPALKGKFNLPFQQHQQLIGSVHEILPCLSRGIDPGRATEPALSPVVLDRRIIQFRKP